MAIGMLNGQQLYWVEGSIIDGMNRLEGKVNQQSDDVFCPMLQAKTNYNR